jgi:hypothetical protein
MIAYSQFRSVVRRRDAGRDLAAQIADFFAPEDGGEWEMYTATPSEDIFDPRWDEARWWKEWVAGR